MVWCDYVVTDATDQEAVTLVEPYYFSNNEKDDIDPPTDIGDLKLSEISMTFHECNETEKIDPVLTIPLFENLEKQNQKGN